MENRWDEWHPRSERVPTYTLDIYVAAPGTPILKDDGTTMPSLSGHMYYRISDGKETFGFGFAPVQPEIKGPGNVVRNEFARYQDPLYRRTLEITEDQHRKLKEFGERGFLGDETSFNLHYNGANNSCVDFVWKGLSEAGIHKRHSLSLDDRRPFPDKTYEGSLKPTRNIDDLERIAPPVPDSPLNKVERNPMPERSLLHKLLSEETAGSNPSLAARRPASPDDVSHPDHALLQQIRGHVGELDRAHGREHDQHSEQLCHSLLTLAKDNGLCRVDHVAFNKQSPTQRPGENVFVVEGGASDPAHLRAQMKTEVAMRTPVAQSDSQLEAVNQQLAHETARAATQEQQVTVPAAPGFRV